MYVKRYYLILFFWILPNTSLSFAQEQPRKHVFTIRSGLVFHTDQDKLMVQSVQSGKPISASLSYQYRGVINRHHLHIEWAAGSFKNSPEFQTLNTTYFHVDLQYGYARRIHQTHSGKVAFYTGAALDINGFVKDHLIQIDNFNVDYETKAGFYSTGIHLLGDYQIDKRKRVTLTTYIPLIAYTLRDRYTITGNFRNPTKNLASLESFQHLNTALRFDYTLYSHFDLGVQYQFLYYRYTKPRTITAVSNGWHIHIGFKL